MARRALDRHARRLQRCRTLAKSIASLAAETSLFESAEEQERFSRRTRLDEFTSA